MESAKPTPALVDIEKVIKDKSPTLKKMLPGFITAYLKRIIHQDELNFYLTEYAHLQGVEFIDAVLGYINTKLELVGLENIPKTEKCIIASNHPLGGLDGMALMLAVSHVRGDIVFPVNDIPVKSLCFRYKSRFPFHVPNLAACFPRNQSGRKITHHLIRSKSIIDDLYIFSI
jgi:hypothetical protein